MQSRLMFLTVVLLHSIQPTIAQDATNTTVAEAPVTRADLGWAYMRLERAYFSNLPTDSSRVAEINQAFDTATKKFFTGKFAETIAEVNDLTASLIVKEPSPLLATALSFKPIVDPPVSHLDKPRDIRIGISPIYPTDVPSGTNLELQLRPIAGGERVVSKPISLDDLTAPSENLNVRVDPAKLSAGAYSIVISDGKDISVGIGQLNVVPSSLEKVRQSNFDRLTAAEANHPEIASAIAACRSRNSLLQDQPSSESSAQFLSDFHELSEAVAKEIQMIEGGRNPYHRRAGDYWRTVTVGNKDKPVPYRVFAPHAALGDQRVPLVVALHGAGGDENMFFEGYGAGLIKQLADQHGFLVATPSTGAVGGRIERFDALIDQLSADYAVDPNAIYLLGHSMGGFTTATIASKRADKLAAACCLAGGGMPNSDALPPMLVIAGELDSVVPTGFLKLSATQAANAGMPVKFESKANYGHTLMVGAVLSDSVNWLLQHRLGGRDQPE